MNSFHWLLLVLFSLVLLFHFAAPFFKTKFGYKIPFRQCYTDRLFGKLSWAYWTVYCHVWLRILRPQMKTLSYHLPIAAIPLLFLALLQTGCKTTSINAAQSSLSKLNSLAVAYDAQEPKTEAAIIAVTGSNSDVSNAFSYSQTAATDIQAVTPLLSGLIALIPTSSTTSAHYRFTAKGIAELHRYHIDPMDRMALAKLMRHYSRIV